MKYKGTFLYNSIINQKDINLTAKVILCQLIYFSHNSDDYSCNPSINFIAKSFALNKRTVNNIIDVLITQDYIIKQHMYVENTHYNSSNRYFLTDKTINLINEDSEKNTLYIEKNIHPYSEKDSKDSVKSSPINNINNNLNNNYSSMSKVPYVQVLELYNSTCFRLSKVRLKPISDKRKKVIKARFEEYGKDIEVFRELFIKANESDFLCGVNERGWKANFDWLLNQQKMTMVLEGYYEKKKVVNNSHKPRETKEFEEIKVDQVIETF